MTSNPSSVAQATAVQALAGPQDTVTLMVREFERRAGFVSDRLKAIPNVRCPKPQGAFYAFPEVSAYLNRTVAGTDLKTGDDLAAYLIDSAHVAVVGGSDFGAPNHIRISYATSLENLERGLDRLDTALRQLP
jgi:aspartate aminotransferase